MQIRIIILAILFSVACGCSSESTTNDVKEIEVLQGSIKIANKTGEFDFGNIFMGESSQEKTFTIKNVGSKELFLSGKPDMIQKVDDATGSFTIKQNSVVSPIYAGNTTSFTVSFQPKSSGVLTAKIQIPNSSESKNPYTFSVTGVGIQTYKWTKQMKGSGDYSMTLDLSGNIYVTGCFHNTVDFGADFGVSDSKTSDGRTDIFVTKINANGSYAWTKRIGGADGDYSRSISLDSMKNIYVTGCFRETVDFGADFGVSDIKTSAGLDDIFVTKLNANGSYGWTKRMGGADHSIGSSITSDSLGNIYVTGYFINNVDFGVDFGVSDSKTSSGYYDIFVTKLNANGSYGWTKRIGGADGDFVYSIISDSSGSIYVTGSFMDTVDFGADFGLNDSKISAGHYDVFVLKINANGSYAWTKRMGGTTADAGSSITSDSSGNIYVTGYFSDTVDFGADYGVSDSKTAAQHNDAFVTKINMNGNYEWTKRMGGTRGNSITLDSSGNIYITGLFHDIVDFGVDFGVSDSKTSAGNSDIFVTKIYANGSYGWSNRMGGVSVDVGTSIALNSSGDIYVSGDFRATVDFGADFGVSDSMTSTGNPSIFLTRIIK